MQHFDVIVVGAGLSGIDAAYRLQNECPDRSYAILEGRSRIGGTWDLFKYPGVRSDSDMFTLGYPFSPWTAAKSIADGADILDYIRATADKFGITPHIRFDQPVTRASWSTKDARWTLTVGDEARYTCAFLYLCSGYFSYSAGHTPTFPGIEQFAGTVVHPQAWPSGLDYRKKRIVVIGSGATAVTLVPTLAKEAAHVTMLQRSPSYIASLPAKDVIADAMRAVLPERVAHTAVRWKNVVITQAFYQYCRRFPRSATAFLKSGVRRVVGATVDVDRHFTPAYKPWDQRLCLVPNADLFGALRRGDASIVTDHIATFDRMGITLESGAHLEADIIVTATGLQMVVLGGIHLDVDGAAVDPAQTFVYKGLMFSGVPNLAWCVGYTNASWTLRADLSSLYVCRLLNYMRKKRIDFAIPEHTGRSLDARPILDLTSGYVQRASDRLPKQGSAAPWSVRQSYFFDTFMMRTSRLATDMRFGRIS